MKFSDIPFHPSSRMLRQFAGIWIAFFGVLAAWQYFGKGALVASAIMAALAVTIGPLGLVFPKAIRPIFVGWMVVAFPIGWTISTLMLVLLYYGMFTPLALVFRWIGRDALCLRPRSNQQTYWVTKPQAGDVRRYLKQF
jgi:hypothetical protein